MENLSLDELRAQIADLEDEAARLSATRSRLHHKIDFGFETATTRDREREVSHERNELHERIDALKEQLRLREEAA
jgi:uncharacterized small protein (DUF1192 family)